MTGLSCGRSEVLPPGSHLCLVDASGYIYRAWHALPSLTRRSDGHPVGAISGFCNMLWPLMSELRRRDPPVTHLVAVFDKSDRSFRNDLDSGYKANRPPAPADLACQFPLAREAARAFGVAVREADGFEADDIIAAFTRRATESGAQVTVVSSDKDLMQLVRDGVSVFEPMKKVHTGVSGVIDKYGVAPEKLADVFALAGDSSDNIRGVKGIGLVTAAELIRRFGDLESVLAGVDAITQPARRRNLTEQADQARLAYRLVTLNTDAPTGDIVSCVLPEMIDYHRLISFLERMEFRTLTRRVRQAADAEGSSVIPERFGSAPEIDSGVYETVTDVGILRHWVERARSAGCVSIAMQTDGVRSVDAFVVGFSLSVGPGQSCYVPLGHRPADLGDAPVVGQLAISEAVEILGSLCADGSVLKVGHGFAFDLTVLEGMGVERIAPIDDIMSLSFVTAAGLSDHTLEGVSRRYLDYSPISEKDVVGAGRSRVDFSSLVVGRAARYAAERAEVILRVWKVLRSSLVKRRVCFVYEMIERPLIGVIADMERAGIMVDRSRLAALSGEFAEAAGDLERAAHGCAGGAFNLGSPRQVGEVLFGDMGLAGGRRTPTGAWSTAVGTLEDLAASGHEIAEIILRWRHVSKLRSTYTEALVKAISPETGRVHTRFSLAGAQTGRLSSNDPNLQNIPVRTEEGRKIRSAFIARRGWRLVWADYSQIELRLLAHIAGIEALGEVFLSGGDVHVMTASEVFGLSCEAVDSALRRRAKAINFGIIYGISAFGLARQLGITRREAAGYIEAYFRRFPGIAEYMEAMKERARQSGYVTTAFGRICHIPMIGSSKPAERAFAERQAINAPIQGSAADIIKRAMVRMPRALEEAGLSARMLLQVHDELVFECPSQECEALMELASGVMERACYPVVSMSVPLTVTVRVGMNWAEGNLRAD